MKIPLLRSLAIVTAAAGLLLGGCAEGPSVPVGDLNSPESAGEPVVLLDSGLSDAIAVDLVRMGPNPTHYLEVQAAIRNRTGQDLEIQAQTLFYDATGAVLNNEPGNETAWTTLTVSANQTLPYHAQALSHKADHLTVRIRFLHR